MPIIYWTVRTLIKKLFNKIKGSRVIGNASWMVGEQMVQMLMSFIIGMISVRYLGPSNYGLLQYCAAYMTFFTSIALLGLEAIVVKELVSHPEKEQEIIGSAILMRLIAGTLSIGSILLILYFFDNADPLIMKVGFLQSLLLVFRAFEIFDFWFQSKLQSKYASILKSISYVLVAGYKIFILATGKTIEWFAFAQSLDFLIIAILLTIAYKVKGGKRLTCSFAMSKTLISQSYHFIISSLIITVYAQIDRVMIKHFIDDTQTGLYSAAVMICSYWALVPTAIINSTRPVIMELKKDGNEAMYMRRLKQLYALLIWMDVAVSLVISLLAKPIMYIVYGEAYLPAAGALAISIWYTTFSVLGVARGNWLVCEGKNKYAKWFVLFGAVANVILNWLLIPRMGIEGAAIATLITQIIVCFVSPLCFKETRSNAKDMLDALVFKFD